MAAISSIHKPEWGLVNMPFSPQLGMNVFDPLQAYASGQPAAEAVIQGQKLALERRQEARDAEKMQWLRQEHERQARANLLREQGMSELQDRINNGEDFDTAFLAVGPRLYSSDPEKLGTLFELRRQHSIQQAHNKAMEDNAREANRIRLMRTPDEEAKSIAQHEENIIDLQKSIKNVPKEAPMDQPEMGAEDYSKLDTLNKRLRMEQATLGALKSKTAPKIPAEEASGLLYDRLQREKSDLESQLKTNPQNVDAATRLKSVTNQLDAWETRHAAEEETIETGPGGVGFKLTKTRGGKKEPGALTVGETTDYGKDLAATSNALRSLGQLKSGLTSEVVGLMPTIANKVVDNMLAQWFPDMRNPERIAGREMIGVSAEEIVGSLRRTGRFSEPEMRRIQNLLPSTGAASAASTGQDKIAVLSRVFAEKGANAATALKRPVPGEVLSALAALTNDQLSEDLVNRWIDPSVIPQVVAYKKQLQQAQTTQQAR